jgi:hypothetical protein
MAIKIGGTTVINDYRALTSISGMDGTYTSFHPYVQAIPGTVIDLSQSMFSKTLSGATTFTYINGATGRTAVLLLDISTSNHVPTFPGDWSFQATPTWSSNRYWIITTVCFGPNDIYASAAGYDDTPSAPALAASFSISGWDHQQLRTAGGGIATEAFARVAFTNDTANDRIDVAYAGGTNAASAIVGHTYISTSSLTNITSVEAQYNVQTQSVTGNTNASNYSSGPLPTSDGYASGTYYNVPTSTGAVQFTWMAKSSVGGSGNQITQTTFSLNTADPDFRIKVVCDQGTLYSTCEFTQGSGSCYAATYSGSIP